MSGSPAVRFGPWALALATLASIAPVLAVLVSGGLAGLLGCPLDEGSVHSCRVGGVELGDALYTGFVAGWLVFLTWPVMLACAVAWLVLAIKRVRRGRA